MAKQFLLAPSASVFPNLLYLSKLVFINR